MGSRIVIHMQYDHHLATQLRIKLLSSILGKCEGEFAYAAQTKEVVGILLRVSNSFLAQYLACCCCGSSTQTHACTHAHTHKYVSTMTVT
jgi:hypothetical protein